MSTRAPHLRIRRGLTFIEVAIAASILAIAGMAALEVLASSDSGGRFARRQALATLEAERTLVFVVDRFKQGLSIPSADDLSEGLVGEALAGCGVAVTSTDSTIRLTIPSATADGAPREVDLAVTNILVEISTPEGEVIASLERSVPRPSGGG